MNGYIHAHLIVQILITLWVCSFTPVSFAQDKDCPEARGVFGKPLDYNDPAIRKPHGEYGGKTYLSMVENVHFTSNVESLKSGQTSGADPMGDIAYTLNAFPNHHRALWSVSRLQFKQGKPTKPSAECLLERAIRFSPKDVAVRVIYGAHLHKAGKLNEALQQYLAAEKINPKWAELHNNIGLLYFDLKQYAQAKQHAQLAYQLGYPLPGLRNKLKRVGQ